MVDIPFLSRCHICGAREDLKKCIICGKKTCPIHLVGQQCQRCIENEALGKVSFSKGKGKGSAREDEKEEKRKNEMETELKITIPIHPALSDLFLLMGGRPGSTRSTTATGSLNLEQNDRQLMLDRQVTKRLYLTTVISSPTHGRISVETRSPSAFLGIEPEFQRRTQDETYATVRTAHDMVVRALDLISISKSQHGIEIISGKGFMDVIQLNQQMACPYCGAWREVCQCPKKSEGKMEAARYFRAMMTNRINQLRLASSSMDEEEKEELREKIDRWERALID